MSDAFTFAQYHAQAKQTDMLRNTDSGLALPLLGLFGEVGSLLSEVKKKHRDPVAYQGYRESVREEFGDVLWYLAALSDRAGLSLEELAANLDRTLVDWQSDVVGDIAFSLIEDPLGDVASTPSPAFERSLLALAGEVGLLMTDHSAGRLDANRSAPWYGMATDAREHHSAGRLDANRSALKGRLIAVLRALRNAAHEAGITLEHAARANLEKIFDRWPSDRTPPPLFDSVFPANEQLPRRLVVEFAELQKGDRTVVHLTVEGKPLGDPLTDNRQEDDDYRFHDVFHLSYAAHLGWSPTLRCLLQRKRKSDAKVDEVEDGARAVFIEEGIATWIFNHAQALAFFENLDALDYRLLKSVRRFVSGYEAEHCPLWLWEEAILNGYNVFRSLRRHRGGRVTADLTNRMLTFAVS